jgi:nucleoside-diphosphate-sugar epimerase
MSEPLTDVVTGAFGFTGAYIARRLLGAGRRVITLTNRRSDEHPLADQVAAQPLDFDRPGHLRDAMQGADTLYNTYWVRFPHGGATFDLAVENGRRLFAAAVAAGVRRIVHVSVANPSLRSRLAYFHGKARLEAALHDTAPSWAVVRPTLVFGPEDILINNIAWMLRRLPVFGVFGRGDYCVQPVFVEDVADLALTAARGSTNCVLDAAGPEVFAYEELVRLIREAVGGRARIVHVRPRTALWIGRLIGPLVGDVIITKQEIEGLMSDLLVSRDPPTGTTRFTDWLRAHAHTLGRAYVSEVARHFRR